MNENLDVSPELEPEKTEPSRRNFKRNSAGGIDCELEHPAYGWIPYTLGPDEAVPEDVVISDADPIPVEVLRADVEQQRLAAYANPKTGSDRHFAEAVRLEAMGDTAGAEAARSAGLARYNEIRSQCPWPEEA